MATHSSVLAWRIPGTGEPGGLLSMGSHRVGHDWSDLAAAAAARVHWICVPNLHQINSWTFRLLPSLDYYNNAAENTGVHVSFWTMFISGYMPRYGIVGSCGCDPKDCSMPDFPVLHYFSVFAQTRPLRRWCRPTISSCHPLFLLPSIFPSLRAFSNELALHLKWTKYWSFSFSPSRLDSL